MNQISGSNVGLKMGPSGIPSSLSPWGNRDGDFFVLDCVGVPICLGLDDQIQKLGFVNLNQYHPLLVMRLLYHIVGYTTVYYAAMCFFILIGFNTQGRETRVYVCKGRTSIRTGNMRELLVFTCFYSLSLATFERRNRTYVGMSKKG